AAAMGCLLVDVQHDVTRTYLAKTEDISVEELEAAFLEMEKEARSLLEKEGLTEEQMQFVRYIDMRYVGQWRSLAVTVGRNLQSMDAALDSFHYEHEREFAFANPKQQVEIYGLRVSAIGTVPKPELPKTIIDGTLEDA